MNKGVKYLLLSLGIYVVYLLLFFGIFCLFGYYTFGDKMTSLVLERLLVFPLIFDVLTIFVIYVFTEVPKR